MTLGDSNLYKKDDVRLRFRVVSSSVKMASNGYAKFKNQKNQNANKFWEKQILPGSAAATFCGKKPALSLTQLTFRTISFGILPLLGRSQGIPRNRINHISVVQISAKNDNAIKPKKCSR